MPDTQDNTILKQIAGLLAIIAATKIITNPVFGLHMTLPNVEELAKLLKISAADGATATEQITMMKAQLAAQQPEEPMKYA